MRLHRFYISHKITGSSEFILDDSERVHQIRRVFRLKTGDKIVIFDGSGSDYVCTISEYLSEHKVALNISEAAHSAFVPSRRIFLFAAIVKKDNFEFVAEKATEMGVTDIVPVVAERTEKKNVNEARLNKIAIEASEQSGRGDIPVVHPVMSLKDALSFSASLTPVAALCFHTVGEKFAAAEYAQSLKTDQKIAIFIGPEGGWSVDEVHLFHEAKIPVVSMGKQVLRAETAAIAALSLVVFDA